DDHRPDGAGGQGGVTVRLTTVAEDGYGVSRRALDLARQISAVARKQSLSPDPSAVQSVLIIPGASNTAEIMPFWRAVLGYEPRPDTPGEDLVDPHDRGPSFWFERMNEPRAHGRGPIHLAIWLPPAPAQAPP